MKKIIAVLLLALTLIFTVSCSEKYEPVESTKEEARVVMTVRAGDEEYEIKYELYRAFFLTYKEEVGGSDAEVWSGEDRAEYIEKINKMIADRALEIYSTLHFAETLGIDPYSNEFEDEISEQIRIGVEGGEGHKGHNGDYGAYLDSLKENNLNYSVSVLLLRYQLTLEAINDYYREITDLMFDESEDEHEASKELLTEYYYSDECVRVLHIFYGDGVKTKSELEKVRDDMIAQPSDMDVALYIINHSLGLESELIKDKQVSGSIIGKYALNNLYYSEYSEAAFTLERGEVSEVIHVKGENPGYYIIYMLGKNEDHFKSEYKSIASSYVDNLVGKKLDAICAEMNSSLNYTEEYAEIVHSEISMN